MSLVQPPVQSRVTYEVRPSYSGLYPECQTWPTVCACDQLFLLLELCIQSFLGYVLGLGFCLNLPNMHVVKS